MESTAPEGVSSMEAAVDGGGGNGVVPTTIHDKDNTMAKAAMVSLTDGGGGNGGRCH
jgi:hypothetical protein